MRYVKVFKPVYQPGDVRSTSKEFVSMAVLIQFSTWGEDGNTDPCAIVEFSNGTVSAQRLDMIEFANPSTAFASVAGA